MLKNRKGLRLVVLSLLLIFGLLAYQAYQYNQECIAKEEIKIKQEQEARTKQQENDAKQKKEKEKKEKEKKEKEKKEKEKKEKEKNNAAGLFPTLRVDKTPLKEDDANQQIVYLSIDDGPSKCTDELLDLLDQNDIKATFFVSAQFASQVDTLTYLKKIAQRGHTLAVHSYSHQYSAIYSSVDAYLQDFKAMDDLIFQASGKHSTIYRFPGGSNTGYNKKIRAALIKEMNARGYVYYDWNAYLGDNDYLSSAQMEVKGIGETSATNRSILLMHDLPNAEDALHALQKVITALKEQGYAFKMLDASVVPIQFVVEE